MERGGHLFLGDRGGLGREVAAFLASQGRPDTAERIDDLPLRAQRTSEGILFLPAR
jgi:hypothetical protein